MYSIFYYTYHNKNYFIFFLTKNIFIVNIINVERQRGLNMTRFAALLEVKDFADCFTSILTQENINACINSNKKRITSKTRKELVELKYDVGLSGKLEQAFKILHIEN